MKKKALKQIRSLAVLSSLLMACGGGVSEMSKEEKTNYLTESAEHIGMTYCNCIENETEEKDPGDTTSCAYAMANSIVEVLMDKRLAISGDQDAQDVINQDELHGLVKAYVEKTCLHSEEDGADEMEDTSEASPVE